MSTLCTFTLETRFPHNATHYVERRWDSAVWQIQTTIRQIETINGFALTVPDLDARGIHRMDDKGRYRFRPAMTTLEFCEAHAEQVCLQRNAQALP